MGKSIVQAIDKNSEEWRHECECRYVLSLPLKKRKAYIANANNARKPDAAKKLREGVFNLFYYKRIEY